MSRGNYRFGRLSLSGATLILLMLTSVLFAQEAPIGQGETPTGTVLQFEGDFMVTNPAIGQTQETEPATIGTATPAPATMTPVPSATSTDTAPNIESTGIGPIQPADSTMIVPVTLEPLVTPISQPTEAPANPDDETPVETSSEPDSVSSFTDDFEGFNAQDWSLAGWSLLRHEENTTDGLAANNVLAAEGPNAVAIPAAFRAQNVQVQGRLQAEVGNTLVVTVRDDGNQSYRVLLAGNGVSRLIRNLDVLAGAAPPATLAPDEWVSFEIFAVGPTITVLVNDVVTLQYTDSMPIFGDGVALATGERNTRRFVIDDVAFLTVDPTITSVPTIAPTQSPSMTPLPPTVTAPIGPDRGTPGIVPGVELPFAQTPVPDTETTAEVTPASEAIVEITSQVENTPEPQVTVESTRDTGTPGIVPGVEFPFAQTPVPDTEATSEMPPNVEATAETTAEVEVTAEITSEIEVTAETTPEVEVTAEVTPEVSAETTPEAAAPADDALMKLPPGLAPILRNYREGRGVSINMLRAFGYSVNHTGAISLEFIPADGTTPGTLASQMAIPGVTVVAFTDDGVQASVSIEALDLIVGSPLVKSIAIPASASPTGNLSAPAAAPSGTVVTEGYDFLGAEDWHNAGFTGTGITIALLDAGNDITGLEDFAAEFACFANPPADETQISQGTHALNSIEILCDIAPNSQVFFFPVDDYSTLRNGLIAADGINPDIILINTDVTAGTTPGDGDGLAQFGSPEDTDPYTLIEQFRQAGVTVIASAGNNGPGDFRTGLGRYLTFEVPAGNPDIRIRMNASALDTLSFTWNDWTGLGQSNPDNLENFVFELYDIINGNPVPRNIVVDGQVLIDFDFQIDRDVIDEDPALSQVIAFNIQEPQNDPCSIAPDGTSACEIELRIRREKGDSPVIMQAQYTEGVFIEQGDDPNVFDEDQSALVGFTSLTGATPTLSAGTLARPADAPGVVAVGAVCANENARFPLYPFNAKGPVFADNGFLQIGNPLEPPISSANLKPFILGPTQVNTALNPLIGSNSCDGSNNSVENAGGFRGTSAAAAHIAGAVALMQQANPSVFNAGTVTSVTAVQNYLLGRSVDRPFGVTGPANGLELFNGAGVFTLGSPNFNPNNSQNPTFEPELLNCTGNTLYVGQGNPSVVGDGSLTAPYLSINTAIENAQANDCVVVMPGEYTTPIYINKPGLRLVAFESVTSAGFIPASRLRITSQLTFGTYTSPGYSTDGGQVQPTFNQRAGIIIDSVDGASIEGFFIYPADSNTPPPEGRTGILLRQATNATIRGNTFGQATVDGDAVNGFTDVNSMPIVALGGAGHIIRDNTFRGNIGGILGASIRPAAIASVDSGTTANTNLIYNNTFLNNTANGGVTAEVWASLVFGLNADLTISANLFQSNSVANIITSVTATTSSPQRLRVVNNVFQQNTFSSTSVPGGGANTNIGPVIHVYNVPPLIVQNNHFVINNFGNPDLGTSQGIVQRGARLNGTNGALTQTQTIDFYNNLIYNNAGMNDGIFIRSAGVVARCDSLDGTQDGGFRRNIFFGSGPIGGCSASFNAQTNSVADPTPGFLGTTNPGRSQDDPLFFALDRIIINDEVNYSQGIDFSPLSANLDLCGDGPIDLRVCPFDRDFTGLERVTDVPGWSEGAIDPNVDDPEPFPVDVGAFEYNDLEIVVDSFIPPAVNEDSPVIAIDMSGAVEGGFGVLTFDVLRTPQDGEEQAILNYGTQCGPEYTDENRGTISGNDAGLPLTILYCPPPNFYTDPTPGDLMGVEEPNVANFDGDDFPDYVLIRYEVSDQSGITDQGNIFLAINPVVDPPLTQSSDETFEVDAAISRTFNLQPRIQFNNFAFIDGNGEPIEDLPDDYPADYPYTYSLNVGDIQGDGVVDLAASDFSTVAEGFIQVTTTEFGSQTIIPFTVTDANGNSVQNTLTFTRESIIPSSPTIYDDASFVFDYYGAGGVGTAGAWQGEANNAAINNTLHTTSANGDIAEFGFRGTGFVLHMQGFDAANSRWNLLVDTIANDNGYETFTGWVDDNSNTVSNPNDGIFESSAGGLTCTTRAIAGGQLTNGGAGAYTVACRGETNGIIKARAQNASTATLGIDAFSLIATATAENPLPPGYHDVDSVTLQTAFTGGWAPATDPAYSNGRAYVFNSGQAPDVSFSIEGGIGFSIQTELATSGANYDLCVTNTQATPNVQTCQRFDNGTLGVSGTENQAFRSFFGLQPGIRYLVELTNIDVSGSLFVFDGVRVYNPLEAPVIDVTGPIEATERNRYFAGGGTDDTWVLEADDVQSALETTRTVQEGLSAVGPLLALRVPGQASQIYYSYEINEAPRATLICVGRADGVSTNPDTSFGNCLLVNLRNGSANVINADGTDGAAVNIGVSAGTILIDEANFRGGSWGAGNTHTIEIFSISEDNFTFDRFLVVDPAVTTMSAGFYEDYDPVIAYAPARSTQGNANDSAGSVAALTNLDQTATFTFTGTGFIPYFRLTPIGGFAQVCWLEIEGDPPTVDTILQDGACREFDTGSTAGNVFQSGFPVIGLPNSTYAVAIRHRADAFYPTSATPSNGALFFDGVEILEDNVLIDDPTTATDLVLQPLNPNVTYNGNAALADAAGPFAYFGTGWVNTVGGAYANFFGGDADVNPTGGGKTIAFFVNQGNAVSVLRGLSSAYTDLLVCAQQRNSPENTTCNVVTNNVGEDSFTGGTTPAQIPATVYLNESRIISDYFVTITGLGSGTFPFDAVIPRAITEPLSVGTYDNSNPNIDYGYNARNLLLNGDFELENDVDGPPFWSNVNNPVAANQVTSPVYTGINSYRVQTNGASQGIQSLALDLEFNELYTAFAAVQIASGNTGTVTMDIPGVDGFTATSTQRVGNYDILRVDFVPQQDYPDARLQFTADSAMTFFVDSAFVLTGSEWDGFFFPDVFQDGYTQFSASTGAYAAFQFFGSGFTLNTLAWVDSGEIEACYLPYTNNVPSVGSIFSQGQCFTFANESFDPLLGVQHTISGLPQSRYAVVVRDNEDGYTSEAAAADTIRPASNRLGRIYLDTITVFDNDLGTISAPGSYSQTDEIDNQPVLSFSPEVSWSTVEAATASGGSYAVSNGARGAAAQMRVTIPANDEVAVVLNQFAPSSIAPNPLLVCISETATSGAYDGALRYAGNGTLEIVDTDGVQNCRLINARNQKQLTFDSATLPLLQNETANPLTRTVSFQAIAGGTFAVDGVTIITGTTLVEGFYDESINTNFVQRAGNWENFAFEGFTEGTAITTANGSAALTYQFTGTGTSVLTAAFPGGGTIQLTVTGDNLAEPVVKTFDTNTATIIELQTALSIANLPRGTYTATVQLALDSGESIFVDGYAVYDNFVRLGSLYDNAQRTADGQSVITYGPLDGAWLDVIGTEAADALGQTLSLSQVVGAVAAFEIGETATGIEVYYDADQTTMALDNVNVCFRDVTTGVETCPTGTDSGPERLRFDAPTAGNVYNVSIIAEPPAANALDVFAFDAVQIRESALTEGIYTAADLDDSLDATLGGGATFNQGSNVINLPQNGTLTVTLSGIGFSFVKQAIAANEDYTITIESDNTTLATVDLPLTGEDEEAITFFGLHDSPTPDTFDNLAATVTLTNNSSSTLAISELHVLGYNDSLLITDVERYENTSGQLRYLPFGSLGEETLDGTSGGSRHIGSVAGSAAYFEFRTPTDTDAGFLYAREIASNLGDVEFCYAPIALPGGTSIISAAREQGRCTDLNNQPGTATLQAVASRIVPDCTDGCWASVRSKDDSPLPVDFVQIFDQSAALTPGLYDNQYEGLRFTDPSNQSAALTGWQPINSAASYGGGYSRNAVAASNLNEETGKLVVFAMQGTGVTVNFNQNQSADRIRMCYLPTPATLNQLLENGVCQIYNSQSATPATSVPRSVRGLPNDEYLFLIQMISPDPDNLRSQANPNITMEIDSIEVLDTNWQELNVLAPGSTYDLDFAAAQGNKRFNFSGTWTQLEGDFIGGAISYTFETDASIEMLVTDASALELFVFPVDILGSVRICATPLNNDLTEVILNPGPRCVDHTQNGLGLSEPIGMRFADLTQATANNYSLTITALSDDPVTVDGIAFGARDIIDDTNNVPILVPGFYEESNGDLFFDSEYVNFINNSGLEVEHGSGNWQSVPDESATTLSANASSYVGNRALRVQANASNTGIASNPFDLTEPGMYTAIARVRLTGGTVQMQLTSDNGANAVAQFTPVSTSQTGRYVTLRSTFTLERGFTNLNNTQLRLIATSIGADFLVDEVYLVRGGQWEPEYAESYTSGTRFRSITDGADLQFGFEGSGFTVGVGVGPLFGATELCYDDDPNFDESSETDSAQQCITYENQQSTASTTVARTIAGLPFDIYYVRIRDVEDGVSVITGTTRDPSQAVGSVGIDYVRVFDDYPRALIGPGDYEDNATTVDGTPLIGAFPPSSWENLIIANLGFSEDRVLAGLGFEGEFLPNFAGQSAVLNVLIPAGGATVRVNQTVFGPGLTASQVLICAGDNLSGVVLPDGTLDNAGPPSDCVIRNGQTSAVLSVGPDDLTALGNPGQTRVTFTLLTPGYFPIDEVQVFGNSGELTAGLYDDTVTDDLVNLSTATTPDPIRSGTCDIAVAWCPIEVLGVNQDAVVFTVDTTANYEFDFFGTGFAFYTAVADFGTRMRVCYKQSATETAFPSIAETYDPGQSDPLIWDNTVQDLANGGIWCEIVTGNTVGNDWNFFNGSRVNPEISFSYGFSWYGLPVGSYTTQVHNLDEAGFFNLDAVSIFGDPAEDAPLQPGLYDDDVLRFEPAPFWDTFTTNSPESSTFGNTQQSTTRAGAIAQTTFNGNAVTIYQPTDPNGSRNIRVCIRVLPAVIHCAEEADANIDTLEQLAEGTLPSDPVYALAVRLTSFQQAGDAQASSPVLLYGFGEGEYALILENRDDTRSFTLDGIEIRD